MPEENMSTVEKVGDTADFSEIGIPGINQTGGFLNEDFLDKWRGRTKLKTIEEMRKNDPIVGASMLAIKNIARTVNWKVLPPNDPDRREEKAADKLDSTRDDMAKPWESFISEAISMVPFGWSLFEMVLKRRDGNPLDFVEGSKFDDGMIGFKRLSMRKQSSLYNWEFDENNRPTHMVQKQWFTEKGGTGKIPLKKCLHFRTTTEGDNPEGEALAPDTPIPTPEGWTDIGDLEAGDKVYDEQGRITYVTATKEWGNRPSYEMSFSSGDSIVADTNHRWVTQKVWERNKNVPASERTTEEVFETQKDSNGVSNHSINRSGPLDGVHRDFTVDPYFLGLWLGDGDTNNARITCHVKDVGEEVEELESRSHDVGDVKVNKGKGRVYRVYDVQSDLRRIGVLGDKHVPGEYLRGSYSQRLSLLKGLMDSDGYVDDKGRCEFTNTNPELSNAVAELVRSLGGVAYETTSIGSSGKTQYVVKFTPERFVPFTLNRKRKRVGNDRARNLHYITDVQRVENRKTVCIEVSADSGMFLAGRSMVPTHNSALRTAYRPWFFKKRIEQFEGIGIERDLAGIPVIKAPARLFRKDATKEEKDTLEKIQRMARNLKQDKEQAIVMPAAYDGQGNPTMDIDLMSASGDKKFDTNEIVQRKSQEIAMSFLADVILLGHEGVGSFGLAQSKTSIFSTAMEAYMDAIKEEYNRKAVPVFLKANGMTDIRPPKLEHDGVETINLESLAKYVRALSTAGIELTGEDIQEQLFGAMDMDPPAEPGVKESPTGGPTSSDAGDTAEGDD